MDSLRPKQKKFVKEYVKNGGNATQAIIDAGYDVGSNGVARAMGSENLTKPNIASAVKSLAERIPDDLLIQKHLELLNAQKIFRTTIKGELVNEEESIDNNAISKGLDMAYKLKGSYVSPGDEKPNVIIMPVLVKFLDKNEPNSN